MIILLSNKLAIASSSYSIISSGDDNHYGVISNPESLDLNSSILSERSPRSNRSNSFSSLRSRLGSFNILDIPEVQSIYIQEESSFLTDLTILESLLLDSDLTNSLVVSENVERFSLRYSNHLPTQNTSLTTDELDSSISIEQSNTIENDKDLLLKDIQEIKNKLIAREIKREFFGVTSAISFVPIQLIPLIESRITNLKYLGISSGESSYIANIWNRIGSSYGKQPYPTKSSFSVIGIDSSTNFDNLIVGLLYSNNFTQNNFLISEQNIITDSFGGYAYLMTNKDFELILSGIFGSSKIFLLNSNYSFQTEGKYSYFNLGLQKELITLIPNVSIIPKIGKSYFLVSIDQLKGSSKPAFYYKKAQISDTYGIGVIYNQFLQDKLVSYKIDWQTNKLNVSNSCNQINLSTSISKNALIYSVIYNRTQARKYFNNGVSLQINYKF